MSYYFPSWQYANWCFPSQSLNSTTKCYGQFKNVYRPLTSPRFWHNRNFKKCVCITKNGEDTRKKKNKNEITDITVSDLNRSTKEYFYMSKMGFFLVFLLRFSFYTNWLHVWKITDRGFKMKFWNHHWTFSVLRLYVGCLLVRKNILQ